MTLATFMEVFDTSIANVALPHIAGNLSAIARREHQGAHQLPGLQRGGVAPVGDGFRAVMGASAFT